MMIIIIIIVIIIIIIIVIIIIIIILYVTSTKQLLNMCRHCCAHNWKKNQGNIFLVYEYLIYKSYARNPLF